MDEQGQGGARRTLAHDVVGFAAVQAQGLAIHAWHKFQRQDAHAHQVGAVDALETFGHDGFHAGQAHALGGPVARGTLAIVGAGDDDQWLLALHVHLDGFPHPRDGAFRLDARERTGLHFAIFDHHLVFQRRVGKRGALRRQMVAPVRGVGIEVFLRQAHLRQIFAGRAIEHDGVRWRQMIGGDVIAQDGQRTHAFQWACASQRAFPVRRTADVRRLRAPVVQGADLDAIVRLRGKHGDIHLAELLRLDAGSDDGVDFLVRWPDILQLDRLAVRGNAQHVLLDIEADGAGDRVGHHQRRRGEESLFRVRVNAAVEVAVTRQNGRSVQVARHHFILDDRIKRARHAVARSAGKCHHAEAQLFQLGHQTRFLQIQFHGFRTGCQRRFHPGFTRQTETVRIARDQAGSDHVARIVRVGAAGDGGDDDGAVRHLARLVFHHAGDTPRSQFRRRHAVMRIRRPRDIAHDGRQVKRQHALVLRVDQAVGPQARFFGIQFDQFHQLIVAACQFQVLDGLRVDVEHGGRGAKFRRHIGNRGTVAQGQVRCSLAVEFQVGRDDLLLAQKFRQRQHRIRGRDARLRFARQLDADDVGQTHPRGAAQHHAFRFQAAHADGDHAQRVDHRRMRIRADQGVGIGHAILHLDHGRHALEVNLVQDAIPRRDHVDVFKGFLGPVDEVETVFIATVFDGAVLGEGIGVKAAAFDGQRMVDHQLRGHHRVDQGRVAALGCDGVTQAGQVDQGSLAQDVMADDAGGEPWKIEVAAALDELAQRRVQGGRVAAAHEVFGQHARGIGQGCVSAWLDRIDGGTRVEVV